MSQYTTNRFPFARRALTPLQKGHAWNLTDGRCAYCGVGLNSFWDFTVDHFVPVARGGSDEITNLLPCCPTCNFRKGDRPAEVLRPFMAGNRNVLGFTLEQLRFLFERDIPVPSLPPHVFLFEALGFVALEGMRPRETQDAGDL